jgi:photosystem II stability/assembly factor-like uncharacterized protein
MSIKGGLAAMLLLAAFAAPAGANVQVGSSGWQWGNPLPQGNTLRAMSFAGQTGYAAGDFGTLLKTTDGGTTWSGLPVGTFQGLTIVQALDPSTVVAGGGCVARRSTDGGATFTAIAFTQVESNCRAQLVDMSFVSATQGFLLLDDGSVFSTTDGGTQFALRTAVPGTRKAGGSAQPTSIAFTSATTGYAATSEGKIFQTFNGGNSWTVVATGGPGINQLWFADPTHGFAVGQGGLFLRTGDGGGTWSPRSLNADSPNYTSIRCANAQLCILGTANGAQLVRTTDAGDTPGSVISPSTDPIYAAAFASPTRAVAAGANGTTVISDTGGVTFTPVGGRLNGSYSAITAGAQRGTAYAPGIAGAYATTRDGGKSWTAGSVPTSADLVDVSFPASSTGYALDRDGGLFATTNAGATWKTLGTGSTQRPLSIDAPQARIVLVAGPRGVRRSTDGGETFSPVSARAVAHASLNGLTAARGGATFAWGAATIALSTDRGATWRTIAKPGATAAARKRLRVRVAQVAFANAKAGLLGDTRGRVWRTVDGGRRWTLLRGVGTERISGMAVSSASTGYLVIPAFGARRGGYLLHTTDGGVTWQPQFVIDAQIHPFGIAAPGGGVDYLLGGDASLLSSTTGGSAGATSALTIATGTRRLAKARTITVTGRLRPAAGTAQVVVSALAPGATRWSHQTVSVASNGTFASSWRVTGGTTTFVAQWSGDFTSAGAGSLTLPVSVAPPKKRRR